MHRDIISEWYEKEFEIDRVQKIKNLRIIRVALIVSGSVVAVSMILLSYMNSEFSLRATPKEELLVSMMCIIWFTLVFFSRRMIFFF